jgi:hypothetical protein
MRAGRLSDNPEQHGKETGTIGKFVKMTAAAAISTTLAGVGGGTATVRAGQQTAGQKLPDR